MGRGKSRAILTVLLELGDERPHVDGLQIRTNIIRRPLIHRTGGQGHLEGGEEV